MYNEDVTSRAHIKICAQQGCYLESIYKDICNIKRKICDLNT